jgi:putative restriction endonuclease
LIRIQSEFIRLDPCAGFDLEAFDYSRILEEKSHLPLVKEIVEADNYRSAARVQGFRRIVTKAYDHRCALCGVRIITPEQHTVVDAAHIVPWSRNKNYDIRNGMALCKLCHWAFDEGMMGVSDNYEVITSRQIAADPNVPGFLLTLTGRGISARKSANSGRPASISPNIGWIGGFNFK